MSIFITGACTYECTGLKALLETHGRSVSLLDHAADVRAGIIIVALSNAPLAGWGRFLGYMKELREATGCHIIALVPDALSNVCALKKFCLPVLGKRRPDVLLSVLERAITYLSHPARELPAFTRAQFLTLFVVRRMFESGRENTRMCMEDELIFTAGCREIARLLGFRHRHHLLVAGEKMLALCGGNEEPSCGCTCCRRMTTENGKGQTEKGVTDAMGETVSAGGGPVSGRLSGGR